MCVKTLRVQVRHYSSGEPESSAVMPSDSALPMFEIAVRAPHVLQCLVERFGSD
jgi:hypothetical protein